MLLLALALALPPAADPPPVPREFRAAWVATVANIDWPSKPGLPADVQKKVLTDTLDRCQALNLNAVVFQVRPMCDALYESELEPWSVVLTGEPGRNPGYDPLAFAVEQAHARGLELHAWFNPYRAWSPTAKAEPPAGHLAATRPELVKTYGKHLWLNPTHPEVQKHSLAVLLDCVKRYDLDGVHMDDYFYPYPEQVTITAPTDRLLVVQTLAGGRWSTRVVPLTGGTARVPYGDARRTVVTRVGRTGVAAPAVVVEPPNRVKE